MGASTIASAALGSEITSSTIIRALAREHGGTPEASIWFDTGPKLPVAEAAQVNAVMSDAAASDDSDLRNIVHAGTTLAATSLAMAERTGANGPEVLAAYKYYWKSDSVSFQDNRSEAEFTLDKMAGDRIILGSPEEVVDQLQRWQEATNAEMLMFRLRQAHSGGPPHDKILRAIRLFGEKVIPKLA